MKHRCVTRAGLASAQAHLADAGMGHLRSSRRPASPVSWPTGSGGIRFDVDGQELPAVSSVERISVETAQGILAENYAAYAAKWGEPA